MLCVAPRLAKFFYSSMWAKNGNDLPLGAVERGNIEYVDFPVPLGAGLNSAAPWESKFYPGT